jgi:hypothetical protein
MNKIRKIINIFNNQINLKKMEKNMKLLVF